MPMDAHANAAAAGAAKAQAWLIDVLARRVLASVEHDATANEQESRRALQWATASPSADHRAPPPDSEMWL